LSPEDVFSKFYWAGQPKTFLYKSCFQQEIRQKVHFTFYHFCCLLEG
jgi:hypothetical protein